MSSARRFASILGATLFGAGIIMALQPASADSAVEEEPQIIGEAQQQGSDVLLYREFYFCEDDGLRCRVDYREPDGTLITQKALDYTVGPYTPGVKIDDLRHARKLDLLPDPEAGLVVDAGFDNYVRSQWDQLAAGETVKFRLQLVDADKPFKMRARKVSPDGCDAEQLCVRVEIDSWLIGLVAPPIDLVYSRDGRQLLRFSGLSNIRSVEDKTQQVDITYRYAAAGRP